MDCTGRPSRADDQREALVKYIVIILVIIVAVVVARVLLQKR